MELGGGIKWNWDAPPPNKWNQKAVFGRDASPEFHLSGEAIFKRAMGNYGKNMVLGSVKSAGPPLGGATRLRSSALSPKSSASALSPKLRLLPGSSE